MQGLGILSAAIVSIITIRCFKDAILYHGASCLAPAAHTKAHGSTACKWHCSPLTLTCLELQDARGSYDVQIACQISMPGLLSAVSFNESSADAKMCDLVNLVVCIADINYLDYVWRIIIGFSAIPTILTIYLRCESPHHTYLTRYLAYLHLTPNLLGVAALCLLNVCNKSELPA